MDDLPNLQVESRIKGTYQNMQVYEHHKRHGHNKVYRKGIVDSKARSHSPYIQLAASRI